MKETKVVETRWALMASDKEDRAYRFLLGRWCYRYRHPDDQNTVRTFETRRAARAAARSGTPLKAVAVKVRVTVEVIG